MRILHVAMGLDPQIGGTVTALVSAVTGEVRKGLSVTVLAQAGDIDGTHAHTRWMAVRDDLANAGAAVHTVSPSRWVGSSAAARFAVSTDGVSWTARSVRRFDVIHIHGAWGFLPLSAALIARARRIPVVLTAHESLTQFGVASSRSQFRRTVKALLRPAVRLTTTKVVFTSPQEQEDSGFATDSRAALLTLGIVMSACESKNEPSPAALSRHLSVGFVGRLHPKKNMELLMRAVASDANVSLSIAGDAESDYGRTLRALAASLGIGDRVTWCGFLKPAPRQDLVRELDVLALPSKFENFGLAAAEAMSAGTPVIVSPHCGIAPTVAAYGGGIVTGTTVPDLTAAFESIRTRTDPRLSRAHTRRVAEVYLSCDAYAQQAVDLYRTLGRAPNGVRG
jgi:glycosyltransferase involved in cell wall biosynthesis